MLICIFFIKKHLTNYKTCFIINSDKRKGADKNERGNSAGFMSK